MGPNRNPRAPGVAPGEPEAPVAAPQAAPAPPAPDRTIDDGAHKHGQRVHETTHGRAVPETERNHTVRADGDQTPEGEGARAPEVDSAQSGEADAAQRGEVDPAQRGEVDAAHSGEVDPAQSREIDPAQSREAERAQVSEDEGVPAPESDEVAAKAHKADQYLELAQRTKADFENYRKRAARETAAAQERGVAKLARELLPAVDNLDRALAHVEGDSDNGAGALISAIKLVHADVIAALARVGIERFSPEGERFDPQRHEAIAQHPVEGAEPGTIVEVYQRGYALGDFVIRPARVVVAG